MMRDKVLGDIRADPLWYGAIIAKRIRRLLDAAPPLRFGFGARYLDVPWTAWLFLPAVVWVVFLRRWDQLALLGFYLHTSLTTIAVFAGYSMSFYAALHLALSAVSVCWVAQGGREVCCAWQSRRAD